MSETVDKHYYWLLVIIGILLIVAGAISIPAIGPISAFPSILGFVLICYGVLKLSTEFPKY